MKKQYGKFAICLVAIVAVLVIAGVHQNASLAAQAADVATSDVEFNTFLTISEEEPTSIATSDVEFSTFLTVAEGASNGESTLQGTDYKSLFSLKTRLMLAQLLYGEADGVASHSERSMVVWCVLNRYDSGLEWFGATLEDIISKPGQFVGYRPENPVTERNLILVNRVISNYIAEKEGYNMPIGRTLPEDIYFFHAAKDGTNHNVFYKMSDGAIGGERIYFGYTPLCTPYDNL